MANGNHRSEHLIAHLHPKSPISEAYRTLRTNLHFSSMRGFIRLILLTSAGPEEGKSTTLANLAVTLAQSGKKVLVADCDLRKPVQHKIFEVPNIRGLTNLLVEGLEPSEVIQETKVPGIWMMTAGPIPPNPAELLDSTAFKELLPKLLENYDHVLIDSPPAVAVTDATIIAPQVHGVLLVIKSGEARNEMVKEAKAILDKANARVIGAVLNGVEYSSDEYRYYYYYGRHRPEVAAGKE